MQYHFSLIIVLINFSRLSSARWQKGFNRQDNGEFPLSMVSLVLQVRYGNLFYFVQDIYLFHNIYNIKKLYSIWSGHGFVIPLSK